MPEKLKGVIPPLVTPFTRDDEVDEAGLRAIVRFLANVPTNNPD
jgi:dihydrodipicolinate synthase/N-acetylneuraminate lyase